MIHPTQHLRALIKEARTATCAKDRRAAALVTDPNVAAGFNGVLVVASNGPPSGFMCTRDAACSATCGLSAVHAEMRALLAASPVHRVGAEMIHARVDETGALMTSRAPRCAACTKHMLDAGVAALWLFHADGWWRYPMVKAHAISAAERGVHAIRLGECKA